MLAVNSTKLAPEICMRSSGNVLNLGLKIPLTFLGYVRIVGPLPKTTYIFREADTGLELRLQDVAFVKEQHEVHLGKKFV